MALEIYPPHLQTAFGILFTYLLHRTAYNRPFKSFIVISFVYDAKALIYFP